MEKKNKYTKICGRWRMCLFSVGGRCCMERVFGSPESCSPVALGCPNLWYTKCGM